MGRMTSAPPARLMLLDSASLYFRAFFGVLLVPPERCIGMKTDDHTGTGALVEHPAHLPLGFCNIKGVDVLVPNIFEV